MPLAATGPQRSPLSPDLPTIAESGLPGFSVIGWVAVMAPPETPEAIRNVMQNAIRSATADPNVRERLASMQFSVVADSPTEFAQTIVRERAELTEVIR